MGRVKGGGRRLGVPIKEVNAMVQHVCLWGRGRRNTKERGRVERIHGETSHGQNQPRKQSWHINRYK